MSRSEEPMERAYGGVWSVLSGLFRVPKTPPTLLAMSGEPIESFRPAPGFLDYLKLWFWLALLAVDGALLVGWIVLVVAAPPIGLLLAPVFLLVAVLPDIFAFIAIHLRYDTTWYVLSDRSMRLRRGIWIIHESTITFENVQNVEVKQGPIQRHFGIANVIVETAGAVRRDHHGREVGPNVGLIEGVADAERIRALIMSRVKRSRLAGLGDEDGIEELASRRRGAAWSAPHLEALRGIRDEIVALRSSRAS